MSVFFSQWIIIIIINTNEKEDREGKIEREGERDEEQLDHHHFLGMRQVVSMTISKRLQLLIGADQ